MLCHLVVGVSHYRCVYNVTVQSKVAKQTNDTFFSTSDRSSGANLVTLSLDLLTIQALTVKSD